MRVLIEENPNKIDIDFIFSDLRVVASLPTLLMLNRFSKKLLPPKADIID
jgi:hypothetical protein